MQTIGWVGLGAMGAPMAVAAARSGHKVFAFDINPVVTQSLVEEGVQVAASISLAASTADIFVIMVATPDQVEAVLFGPDGAAKELREGSVVLLMATVGPGPVTDWAGRLAERHIGLVDAPVSGGVARAALGDLLIMVSGDPQAIEIVKPLLDSLARTAPIVGETPGDGQRVKLVNQLLCGVHIAVAGEALAFAESLGLDARACWEVIRQGAASSFMLDDRGDRMLVGEFDQVKSALDIFVKDMGLVNSAALANGMPVPLAETAADIFLRGHQGGLGRKDDSAVIQIFRNWTAFESVTT